MDTYKDMEMYGYKDKTEMHGYKDIVMHGYMDKAE